MKLTFTEFQEFLVRVAASAKLKITPVIPPPTKPKQQDDADIPIKTSDEPLRLAEIVNMRRRLVPNFESKGCKELEAILMFIKAMMNNISK